MRIRAALAGALLAVLAAGPLFGQGFQGGLRGVLKDAGGVLPGVEVTLTNEQTNIARSTVTNERGEYVFANVDPGTYKLKGVLQGYKTVEQGGLRIGTQEFLVLDVVMEVGRIEENVTVTGQAPIIDTANASQGTVLDTTALQSLPSAGRNPYMIGASVPTVVPSGDGQFNRQQDQTNASLMSLGGGTRRGNNYTLDGVPFTDMRNRMSATPTIESIDDMKVQVHTYDAEMGRTGGGVFNATIKSGTNNFHGAAFLQTRPVWSQTENYFSAKAGQPKPDSPYIAGGGGFGGPIKKDQTFFWFATEDYHDVQTRNASIRVPTAQEIAGNFSGLFNTKGQQVVIYNPLTHLPFAGNVIPSSMLNPVAVAMAKYLPAPNTGNTSIDNGTANYNVTSTIDNKFQQEYAFKVEHKFTDKVSLAGFYLYNRTNEPCANYFGSANQSEPTRFADPLDYILQRRPQVLALNNTWVLSDSSVLALRYGLSRFPDNNTLSIAYDPHQLPFASNYLALITQPKFPDVDIAGYDALAAQTLGAIDPTQINYKSQSANASYSRFFGTHTVKAGGDFRKIGMDSYLPGPGAGLFKFDNEFTSSNGTNNSDATSGNAFASYLLGYPSADAGTQSTFPVSTPLNVYSYYFGGYVQDDWRANSKLTVNYGLRIEHETGLAEQNNNFTTGFDPAASLPGITGTVIIPADPIAGTAARTVTGGLQFAGVNGQKTTQGAPPAIKWSPRVGIVYSFNPTTVLRAGYGLYWAPWNYPAPSTSASNYGQDGYTQNTVLQQTVGTPTTTLTNPFPLGVAQPTGNSLGPSTLLNNNISFIDPNHTAPRVQQYSADVQKELGGGMALVVSYVGARGDHLPLGGSNDVAININQLDPKYLALGSAALGAAVPNPFFGNPNVPAALATATTISRARSLMPYPQFNQVLERQVAEGLNRYNAAVVELNKRVTHGVGWRISYTYSSLQDNQWGETNFYSAATGLPMNNYNYISTMPACQAGQQFSTACYDPRAEYGPGILDVPQRLVIAPIFELPFGKGKAHAQGDMADMFLGGWTIGAILTFQSGFPINVQQSNPNSIMGGNLTDRPNLSGTTLSVPGGFYDQLASADHPTATSINPAGFSLVSFGQFGNAPRTITDVRTPGQANTDLSAAKNIRLGSGGHVLQVKIEVINLFDRPNVRALQGNNNVSLTSFGQTNLQSGFMRQAQFMCRYQF